MVLKWLYAFSYNGLFHFPVVSAIVPGQLILHLFFFLFFFFWGGAGGGVVLLLLNLILTNYVTQTVRYRNSPETSRENF